MDTNAKALNDAVNALKAVSSGEDNKPGEDTNKPGEDSDKPDENTNAPQTGISSNIALWITIALISSGAVILLTLNGKKKAMTR